MSHHPTNIPPGTQHNSSGPEHRRYFFDTFGITERLLERCLGEALSAGGDYADLYFESIASTSIGLDESLVKSASQGMSAGCGVRVVAGERTGYAYTDDLSADRLLRAARTAALIASGPAKEPVTGFRESAQQDLYPVLSPEGDANIAGKLDLLLRADRAARAADPRIVQVRASFSDEVRRILVAASDGTFASDTQPLAPFNGFVIAKAGANIARGSAGGGGRVELDYFHNEKNPEGFAQQAVRQAILPLEAAPAPA